MRQFWVILLIHTTMDLVMVSKTERADSALLKEHGAFFYEPNNLRNKSQPDSYIPVYLKKDDKKIEARIPVIVSNRTEGRAHKRKSSRTNISSTVPIVRGAAVPLRSDLQDLHAEAIEGLHPPSQTAAETWAHSQHHALMYPNSNGYFPNVGDYDGGYPSTSPRPRPTYGPPSPPSPPHWGCPSSPWGQGETYPTYPNTERPYDTYPTTPNYQSSGCPPQHHPTGCTPTNNNYYPSGNPTSQNQPPQHQPSQGYPSGYPPSSSSYPQYPGPSSSSNYPQSSWQYSGRPWKSQESKGGQWVPCRPFDLTATDGKRRFSTSGCPQNLRSANIVRFEPDATPVTKVDDKINFQGTPNDVEMLKP